LRLLKLDQWDAALKADTAPVAAVSVAAVSLVAAQIEVAGPAAELKQPAARSASRDFIRGILRRGLPGTASGPVRRPGTGAAGAGPAGQYGSADGSSHPRFRAFQWFMLKTGVPVFLFVVTVVGVAICGLQNQYFAKPTFGAGGLGDWITLFAWGFGTGLAGRAIGVLVGQSASSAKPGNLPSAPRALQAPHPPPRWGGGLAAWTGWSPR
jgi:hypothetical protein